MGSSFGTDDYFVETDDELDHDYNQLNERDEGILQNQGFLEVPLAVSNTQFKYLLCAVKINLLMCKGPGYA